MKELKILLLSKRREDFYAQQAIDFTTRLFPQVEVHLGLPREPMPAEALNWQGDYILSYLCPWVVPAELLSRASQGAINFHPAPPQYPGTGCTNFAIYDGVKEFGATCHYMAAKVDSGKVIAVNRFPVFEEDSVYSLTQRCYTYMLALFFDIVSKIARGETLPESDETWTRKPYRLKDLNELKRITPDMPAEEVHRRIKAVTYPGYPGAYVEIAGERFTHTDKNLPK